MRRGYIFAASILVVSILLSAAEDAPSAVGNGSANVTAAEEQPVSVTGIWKVSLAGRDITMALNQSGDSVFGQARSEGSAPWNGVVAGSISGELVHLAMAASDGGLVTSTYMTGDLRGGSIAGWYVRSDISGTAARGELSASQVSTDTSAYTPASEPSAEDAVQPAKQDSSERFRDVTRLARGIDPNILPRMASL
ncbi:MAG: hypothetical protein QUS08_03210 [Methanothrix sp.]|nr:hypothetical protein [Methanothrix sp.]